ncbi:hypothetical protein EG329_009829 [Mollisiaceae sp. DMI_Dod_QoI]|nr:hypothetical protein EG329_009829 [Helotiales sp. DMI_Dod_QoI]
MRCGTKRPLSQPRSPGREHTPTLHQLSTASKGAPCIHDDRRCLSVKLAMCAKSGHGEFKYILGTDIKEKPICPACESEGEKLQDEDEIWIMVKTKRERKMEDWVHVEKKSEMEDWVNVKIRREMEKGN